MSVCLLKPFPSFARPSRCVPVGLGAAPAPGIVVGPRVFPRASLAPSPSVGCKRSAALPARTVGRGLPVVPPVDPSPVAVPSTGLPGAEPPSPLSRSGHGGSADLPVLPAGAGGRGRR